MTALDRLIEKYQSGASMTPLEICILEQTLKPSGDTALAAAAELALKDDGLKTCAEISEMYRKHLATTHDLRKANDDIYIALALMKIAFDVVPYLQGAKPTLTIDGKEGYIDVVDHMNKIIERAKVARVLVQPAYNVGKKEE